MSSYNLNEVLKEREKTQKAKKAGDEELKLDDVARVKVLSPGRQVFKRFVRNRLAVFGSVTLIILFIFSFLGPIVYGYGQKDIFYKYDEINVNYALAKENATYNGYVVDDSLEVDNKVLNAMNSNIKSMIADDIAEMSVVNDKGSFIIRKEADEIYSISAASLTQVATIGNVKVEVGEYDGIKKEVNFKANPVSGDKEGFVEAAKASVKGSGGTFTYEGVEYSFKKVKAKSFTIEAVSDGLNYSGEDLGEEFAAAAENAASTGESFTLGDKVYSLSGSDGNYTIFEAGDASVARVYTRYTLDTMETGLKVSDSFKAAALMAIAGDGSFEADGESYTIAPNEENTGLVIKDEAGEEYAEFGTFTVRRYTGEDSMDFDLKIALENKIAEMLESGSQKGSLTYKLPMQDADGTYSYDEDGNLLYNDADLDIAQRDTGEFVIKANQINYVIDMFAAPSAAHILGTDGDGFDVMSRIMYGGRVSLLVGFVVVFLEIFLGVIMGGLAGYYGGWVDNLIMRLVDIFYCLPSMPIMIILGAMMDAARMDTYMRLFIMMIALGVMGWAGVARLVRGQILSLREQEFMVAAEATGIKVNHRIFRHLIPNVIPQLIVTATMGIGGVILTESTLSFLGLGVKHPLATWGTIINSVSSASAMAHYAFIWIPVGLLICLTVIAFNFVGDGLRDAYDPKAKR
ncbi:ABC transporter permease [Butyrivibrio sp. MC2013]|uniref:ABC transporter permease n=1 Tax=Butyrivibrio sp. MC2013 TaxID=1280686 RepID=UPI0004002190|nr:ABC transporter permease [Butyrivibrio sp. MC2013]